jgi:two-component system, chemotaxis family, chemotaxis protein CheY
LPTASTITALVIDDSRVVRSILRNYLSEMGISALEAGDGAQALVILAEHPEIMLALVDWNMPVMDGLQFISEVRRQSVYADLKIVMVTTESESEQIMRAMAAGANEYVMKPFTKEVLEAKLSMLDVLGEA